MPRLESVIRAKVAEKAQEEKTQKESDNKLKT